MSSDLYTLQKLTPLYNEIISELPGLAPDHAKRVIRSSVNRFLERSGTWRATIHPDVNSDGIAPLDPPDCAVICSYRDVRWKDNMDNKPNYYETSTPYELQLVPAPSSFESGNLLVTVLLKMCAPADKIPDYILDTHNEALRATSLTRLLLEPAKPYSDAKLGALYAREANARTMEARDIAERMYGRNEHQWMFPRWA